MALPKPGVELSDLEKFEPKVSRWVRTSDNPKVLKNERGELVPNPDYEAPVERLGDLLYRDGELVGSVDGSVRPVGPAFEGGPLEYQEWLKHRPQPLAFGGGLAYTLPNGLGRRAQEREAEEKKAPLLINGEDPEKFYSDG